MALLTRVDPILVSPPAENRIRSGVATEAISKGQLVAKTAAGYSKLAAAAVHASGIALKDYYAGQTGCDFGITGEMDGFGANGNTVGAFLYPSASVAGGMDTAVPTGAAPQIQLIEDGRISFNFV